MDVNPSDEDYTELVDELATDSEMEIPSVISRQSSGSRPPNLSDDESAFKEIEIICGKLGIPSDECRAAQNLYVSIKNDESGSAIRANHKKALFACAIWGVAEASELNVSKDDLAAASRIGKRELSK
ncbi:hypothetical protein HDU93_007002, partial [Gonapodya sp. JEL0774]